MESIDLFLRTEKTGNTKGVVRLMESSTEFTGEESQQHHYPWNVMKPGGMWTVRWRMGEEKGRTERVNFGESHGIQKSLKGTKC